MMLEIGLMRFFFTLLLTTALSSSALSAPSKFLSAPFWDDGKAEISIYEAKRSKYGNLYPTEVRYFLVKESFNSKEMVKSDNYRAKNAIPVIKLNQVITMPTGTYIYQQMHSSFWSKDSGELLKFSMSHHEACGASYKQGVRAGNHLNIEGTTYWEGQSRIEDKVEMRPMVWFYDELPIRARMLLADGHQAPTDLQLQLIPFTLHSKAGSFKPAPAQLSVADHTVTITHAAGTDVLEFDPAWPHVMTSWQQANGSSMTLKKSLRLDYWNHQAPGDETLLE